MPDYQAKDFDPPAPFAEITITNPTNSKQVLAVGMLLDSGADITLIPEWVIDRLEAETIPNSRYDLVGFTGDPVTFSAVRLELTFCGKVFRGQFLPVQEEWGIIGRNVLNSLSITLDGPSLAWFENIS